MNLSRRLGGWALQSAELLLLTALIVATRCANYQDVFVGGNVYFTDADCYARMMRVRMCQDHPGLIVRHHDFENFPTGTTPHTTAPLDYLILALSILCKPFSAHALDLAGALVSPLLAVIGGWFLWWWSRKMKFRYRWAMLILYAISPILVQGTELGRPDHQSLLLVLVTVAICAEWTLQTEPSIGWSVLSGLAWGLAIWVSAYEPLVLLLLVLVLGAIRDQQSVFGKRRRIGWIVFALMIALALVIERRLPSISFFQSGEIFQNWSRTIGELAHVPLLNRVWFRWAGGLLIAAPFLIWFGFPKKTSPPILIIVLLAATYLLTIWQARWAYFFVSIFLIALPSLLEAFKSGLAVCAAFILSIFPILRDWDEKFWPNEVEYGRRVERRDESIQLRDLALNLKSSDVRPFLAPWWLSPAIAYWSDQPGVSGSSHESLGGTADSARFFLSDDSQKAREILQNHKVEWVLAYDADRVVETSAALLGAPVPERPLGRLLYRTPAQAPPFLVFAGQNGVGKLFRVVNNR